MMRHFAVAPRARELPVLLASMRRWCGDFALHVLAWDFEPYPLTHPALDHTRFDGPSYVECTRRDDFLTRHPEFAPSCLPGPPRRVVDQVATARWRFYLDVMERIGEPLMTLDGDMFAFGPPDEIFEEIGRARMAVVPHRIPPRSRGLPGVTYETHWVYGEFNSALTYWADPEPLRDMSAATYAWSYGDVRRHPVDGRPDYGDQGALQRVAERHGAHVIANPAAAPGPWNVHNESLAPGMYSDAIYFGGRRLCFYHFSSMRFGAAGEVLKFADAPYEITDEQRRILYDPYAMERKRHAG